MKNITVDAIIEQLTSIKPELEEEFDIKEIGVFGSYIRNEQLPTSDIDILIELKENHSIGLIKFSQLRDKLSHLLGKNVDLVTKSGIKPALKKYILQDVIYV